MHDNVIIHLLISCLLSAFALSSACEAPVVSKPSCGDGLRDPNEECDGRDFDDLSCGSLGYPGGELGCTEDCRIVFTSCTDYGLCGNGVREDQEECDREALHGQSCLGLGYYGGNLACTLNCTFDTRSCALAGRCGDDVVQDAFGEMCESTEVTTCSHLGYYSEDLVGCSAACTWDESGCVTAGHCGDGVLDVPEDCDGDELGESTCASLGYHGGSLFCGTDCHWDLSDCEESGRCGDGILDPGFEECEGEELNGHRCSEFDAWTGELACSPECEPDPDSCGRMVQLSIYQHSCARLSTGQIYCWGNNYSGQLGDGSSIDRLTPRKTLFIEDAIDLCTSVSHSCAVGADGSISCWGNNEYGQLGTGDQGNRFAPSRVTGIYNATQVACAQNLTCARLSDRTVKCWGLNAEYYEAVTTPTPVPGLTGTQDLTVGGYSYEPFACATLQDGTARCWGHAGYSGRLGNPSANGFVESPVEVAGLTGAEQIAAGYNHVCVLRQDGTVWCWGGNGSGQLGDGSFSDRATPAPVLQLSAVSSLSSGGAHSCALRTDGSVWCWGTNGFGQFGNGSTSGTNPLPVNASGLTCIPTLLAAGSRHTCAACGPNRLFCWGANDGGQLGDGSTEDRLTPVEVQAP